MNYPGFCTKYGQNNMLVLSLAFGCAAGVGIEALVAHSSDADAYALAFMSGMIGGQCGATAGAVSHIFSNLYCSEKGMGISKGGLFVKKVQAASYAALLATSIGLQQSGLFDIDDSTKKDTSDNAATLIIKQPNSRKIDLSYIDLSAEPSVYRVG